MYKRERSQMTEEIQECRAYTQRLTNEYNRLLDRREREKIAAEKRVKEAVGRSDLSDAEVRKLQWKLGELQKQLQHNRHERLIQHIHDQQKNIQSLQYQIGRMEIQHSETRELLEARRLELASAQSFLTTADSLSGTDASVMLEGLNDEIFQVAASMAESFEFRDSKADLGEDRKIACNWVGKHLGPTMLELLRSVRHCEEQLVVQIALQACMTKLLGRTIPRWNLDRSKDQSLLVNIHSYMWEEEDQAISGRWRALTHAYARKALQSQSDIPSLLQSSIVKDSSHVLVTAGCTADRPMIQEKLQSKFASGISVIVDKTIRLHQALGEEVTSGNLEVICIPSGDTFDAAIMEDNDGKSKMQKGKDGHVLCTTALGLRRRVRAGMKGGERSWQETDLLKSKVALESVTNGMAKYDMNKTIQ